METNHDVFLSRCIWDVIKDFGLLLNNVERIEEWNRILTLLRNPRNRLFVDIPYMNTLIDSYKTSPNENMPIEAQIAFKIFKARSNFPIFKSHLTDAINDSDKPGVGLFKKQDVGETYLAHTNNKYIYTENNLEEKTFSNNDVQDIMVSPDMRELRGFITQTHNIYINDIYLFNDSSGRDRVLKMPNIFNFFKIFIRKQEPEIRINILSSGKEAEKDPDFVNKISEFREFARRHRVIITIVLFRHIYNLPRSYQKSERFILTDFLSIKNHHPFDRRNRCDVAFMPNQPMSQSLGSEIIKNFQTISEMASQNGKLPFQFFSPDGNIQKYVFKRNA